MIDMRTARLRYFLQALDEVETSSQVGDMVLGEIGLNRSELLENSMRLPADTEMLFVEKACEQLRDSSFAARVGLGFHDDTALTSHILKYSRTLRHAIDHSARYYKILDPSVEVSLHVSGNFASFELGFGNPVVAQLHRFIEYLMFSALNRMHDMTGAPIFPLEIRFPHAAQDAASEINRLAGCPVVFDSERCEMILSLSALELPIPGYDPNLRAHLMEYGNRLRAEAQPALSDLRTQVEAILVANLPGRIVQADEVAANLGMSRRTFARRLCTQGISYRNVLDELRCDLACSYLRGDLSIAEIAFFLDYADQAAFSTAFKRWTGHSPNQYRQQL